MKKIFDKNDTQCIIVILAMTLGWIVLFTGFPSNWKYTESTQKNNVVMWLVWDDVAGVAVLDKENTPFELTCKGQSEFKCWFDEFWVKTTAFENLEKIEFLNADGTREISPTDLRNIANNSKKDFTLIFSFIDGEKIITKIKFLK